MNKKLIVIIGVIVIIIVIVGLNVMRKEVGKEVEVTLVKRGEIVSQVTASGIVRAKSQVDISAETIGRIEKIYYHEGDYVKKGALLIALDAVTAEASFKLAQAQLQQAEQDYNRGKQLFEKALISRENFEKVVLAYETAKAQHDETLDAYEKTKIYAPISGKIMKINVEEGETAVMGTMNYQGTVLMTIADMSKMITVVKIDEADIPEVKLGQIAEVTADALPDSVFRGEVTKIGLMPITSQLGTESATDFEVEIELSEFSELLRPGMNVKTEVITGKKSDVLVIPIQAAGKREVHDTLAQTVFIVKNKKAQLTEITMGISSDTDVEIVSGIAEGDTVIIGPFRVLSTLKDGQAVKTKFEEKEEATTQSAGPRRLFRAMRRGT